MTFQVAVDDRSARRSSTRWRTPSIVRAGSSIAARQADGNRVAKRRRERGERVANSLRSRRGEVAVAHLGCLRTAERPLVEEEELEVLPPAERAIEAGCRRVRDRRVVAERLDPCRVDGLAVLRSREVVDELVVVPMAVETCRGTKGPERRQPEPEPVLRPLLPDGPRDGYAADLAIRVDGVAEIDVEVVRLGVHALVDLVAVVRRLAVRARRRIRVARDREPNGGGDAGCRRGRERADRALRLTLGEEVAVLRAGLQPADDALNRQVVGAPRPHGKSSDGNARARRDGHEDSTRTRSPRPEDRRRGRHLSGRHPFTEAGISGIGGNCGEHERRDGSEDDQAAHSSRPYARAAGWSKSSRRSSSQRKRKNQ